MVLQIINIKKHSLLLLICAIFFFGVDIFGNDDKKCVIKSELREINGDSMSPFLKFGENITLLSNYYDCNEIKRNDIIAYNHSRSKNPLIKSVKVLGGDEVLIKDSKIFVNGQVLKNRNNEKYEFTEKEQKMLSLYLDSDSKLRPDSYFIFGEQASGSLDSRKFGAVSIDDFLGRFVI